MSAIAAIRRRLRPVVVLACLAAVPLCLPTSARADDRIVQGDDRRDSDGGDREPVTVGIAIGVAASAVWLAVDSLVLSALYYGIGVVALDNGDCGVHMDDDSVTRTTWLVEDYVDFDAFLVNECGNVKEERHFFIPHSRWSAVYRTKEWVLPNGNHKGGRGWELRKKGEVILKGSGFRSEPRGGGDPWAWDVATAQDTTITLETSMQFSPDDMYVVIEGATATVSFAFPVVTFINGPDPLFGPFGLSHGLTLGSDVASPELPSTYDITIFDAVWTLDPAATVPYSGQPEDELRRMGIAAAARLVVGPRATPGWTLPPDAVLTVDDVAFDGVYYNISYSTQIAVSDVVGAAGYGGVYQYAWDGPGEPNETTELPTSFPGDAILFTAHGAEMGGAMRMLPPDPDAILVFAPPIVDPCIETEIVALVLRGSSEVPGEQVLFRLLSGDAMFLGGVVPETGESDPQTEFILTTGPDGSVRMPLVAHGADPLVVDVKVLGRPLEHIATIGLRPTFPGDMDCDGDVDFDDIDPFVLALGGPDGYYATYPHCNHLHADVNGDCAVDFDDIDPFVELLAR